MAKIVKTPADKHTGSNKTPAVPLAATPAKHPGGNARKARGPSQNQYVIGIILPDENGKLMLDPISRVQPTVGRARKLRETMREMGLTKAKDACVLRIRVVPEKESSNGSVD